MFGGDAEDRGPKRFAQECVMHMPRGERRRLSQRTDEGGPHSSDRSDRASTPKGADARPRLARGSPPRPSYQLFLQAVDREPARHQKAASLQRARPISRQGRSLDAGQRRRAGHFGRLLRSSRSKHEEFFSDPEASQGM